MPLLEIDGLAKRYGALRVTDRISFALEPGAALGIIGPNGAGKTTLFNLIAGTVRADAGTIRFEGRDITRLPARARCRAGIARSFQIPQPFAGMTCFENVLVAAAFGRLAPTEPEARAVAVLELTGLWRKANVVAGALTLIERKRLEMARALATDPKLLLLDEIAGGLTEPESKALVEAIHTIRASGVAIVWIEHVLHALTAVIDRLIVIDFGRMIADGDPREVMARRDVAEIYLGLEGEPDAHG